MKLALIGYGKMGKELEKAALSRGHEVVLKVNSENSLSIKPINLDSADVAIEFSTPKAVPGNIRMCFSSGLPVVVGTTGWYEELDAIKNECINGNQSMIYASNFSIGVNILFELNRMMANIMNHQPDYDVSIEEIHHSHKLDSPSGTALVLAKDIISLLERKERWIDIDPDSNEETHKHPGDLTINSMRLGEVIGTHIVKYRSNVDKLELRHEAYNRTGFAEGAIIAAEWLMNKKGCFTMQDLLNGK
ncbi:MAG: 4-hydroxy-tetrahydrodipicolinate reductase [Bacteroidetes bacterium]|nr:4-hydroxy-tetrahydrodipicolinate reductase [Bacteroidota bacterium]